jgi:molecular chaperone GrpE
VTGSDEFDLTVEDVPPSREGGTSSAAHAVPDVDVDELLARTLDAEAKRDEYLADLQRVAADFDNYRKRVAREQALLRSLATADLVRALLPVVDDLERALDAAEHHDEAKVIEGVRLTRDTLLATLRTQGLEEIDADGMFDPHVHEALLAQPAEGVAAGSILEVVQRGYRLGDTVLRPTRVVVAAEPAQDAPLVDQPEV